MKLSNKITAVITGGASGLGEATARAFAAKGVKVGIFDMNEVRGAKVANEIGGVFAKVNVADEASVDAGFEAVRAENGIERLLINCAGIGLGMKTASRKRDTGAILAHDAAAYKRVIDINLYGSFLCASKSAAAMMESMALPMARDLAREGIRVNTILPGFYETPIYEQMKPEVKESLRAHVQFPVRFGQPSEFGEVAVFMAEHAYINANAAALIVLGWTG